MSSHSPESGDNGNTPPSYHMMSSAVERQNLEKKIGKWTFALEMLQQPRQSRMCGVGVKNNRRPIDPPPVVAVRAHTAHGTPVSCHELECVQLLSQVTLIGPDNNQPVVVNARERQMTPLVGVTNATPHRIVLEREGHPTTEGEPIPVFAFTDLSIRQEGRYRLQFDLFEVRDGELIWHTSIISGLIQVFPAKGFPGMAESTPFTSILKKHGIRVRVSKSIRASKKLVPQVDSESTTPKFTPEDDEQQRLRQLQNRQYSSEPQWGTHILHNRRDGPNYGDPTIYNHKSHNSGHYLPSSGDLLPPPQHAQASPHKAPRSLDRGYDRNDAHQSEYQSSFSYGGSHGQNAMHMNERKDTHGSSYNDRWRHGTGFQSSHYGSTSALNVPHSPQMSASTSYNTDRRYTSQDRSASGHNALPPLQYYQSEGHSNNYSDYYPETPDFQTASRAERPNGQDQFGHQFQPPPTQASTLPQHDQAWSYYSNSNHNVGYHNGEQYHGSG